VVLADANDEGMEFVVVANEILGAFGSVFGAKGLLGEGLNCRIFCAGRHEAVADGNAAQVLVDDHGGNTEGVEKDRIGGFRTDAREIEQVVAGGGHIQKSRSPERFHAATVALVEKGDEGLERGGFADHEAGGTDEFAQFAFGNGAEAGEREDAASAEVGDGALDGFPGGVLGEVSADDDFERSPCRPPLLRAVEVDEAIVESAESAGGGHRFRVQGSGDGLRGTVLG